MTRNQFDKCVKDVVEDAVVSSFDDEIRNAENTDLILTLIALAKKPVSSTNRKFVKVIASELENRSIVYADDFVNDYFRMIGA